MKNLILGILKMNKTTILGGHVTTYLCDYYQ